MSTLQRMQIKLISWLLVTAAPSLLSAQAEQPTVQNITRAQADSGTSGEPSANNASSNAVPLTLAQWDFAERGGASSVKGTSQEEGVLATRLTAEIGPGMTAFSYLGNGLTAYRQTATTFEAAIAEEEYISFTIAPEPGKALSLKEVAVRPVSQNVERSFVLTSSVSGFDTKKIIGVFRNRKNFASGLEIIKLSGHDNLTDPVEFRLYIYGADDRYMSVGMGNRRRKQKGYDLAIRGSVAAKRKDPPAPPNRPVSKKNLIGINTGNPGIDYNADKVFADAMRSHRRWETGGRPTSLGRNYWPTEDGICLVYHGLKTQNNHGTYRLSFTGQATVNTNDASLTNFNYSAATNTTTADLIITKQDNSQLSLKFSDTKRTPGGRTNTGVTNVRLMRPTSPGSAQSYPTSQVFNQEYLEQLAPFSCLRGLGWTSANTCGDSLWSNRTLWTHATQHPPALPNRTYGWEGRGASWESLIMIANTLGIDLWINVPHKATDHYIEQLATLFRDGNKNTPGLRKDLKLYVEYSNEIWNSARAFQQTLWVRDQAAQYGAPLNFDGEDDAWTLMLRYKAMRTVQISDIFRSVFGDKQMMTHVRPVICWQKAYNDLTARTLSFIDRWYNKRDSRSTVGTPHPLNYYLYGGGGSGYWSSERDATPQTIWDSKYFDPDRYYDELTLDASWAKAFGLSYLAYEGDVHPSYWSNGQNNESLYNSVHINPKMRQNTYEHLQAWSQVGGELFCFLSLNTVRDERWGWGVRNVTDPGNSPQLEAIVDFVDDAPLSVTLGPTAPFEHPGKRFDALTWEERDPDATGSVTLTTDGHRYAAAYNFRTNTLGTYTVQVEYRTDKQAQLALELAGNEVGRFNLSASPGQPASSSMIEIECAAKQLYSLRLVATSGEVDVYRLSVKPTGNAGARTAGSESQKPSLPAEDELLSQELTVYPVPTYEGENIMIQGIDKPLAIELISLSGSVLSPAITQAASQQYAVSTTGLTPGVYMLRISTQEGTARKRVVVR